jgi:hypothetical protein
MRLAWASVLPPDLLRERQERLERFLSAEQHAALVE